MCVWDEKKETLEDTPYGFKEVDATVPIFCEVVFLEVRLLKNRELINLNFNDILDLDKT